VQLLKALLPISVIEDGIESDFKLEQYIKTSTEIDVTPSGINREVNEVQ